MLQKGLEDPGPHGLESLEKRHTQASAPRPETGVTTMSKYVMDRWGKGVRGGEMNKKVKPRGVCALWRDVEMESQQH